MSEVFRCDDKDTLIAYLYGEVDADVRREVERHLRTCAACTRETDGLQTVRQDLQAWNPPEPGLDFELVPRATQPVPSARVLTSARWSARDLPAWARIAAAALFIGVGLGVANVQVRSTSDGYVVTTGWLRPPAAPIGAEAAPQLRNDDWRPELAALARTLRGEMAAQRNLAPVAARSPAPVPAADSGALLRRVEALIEASEQRQRQELATKLVQANTMWTVQRQTDLANFQRSFNGLQNRTLAVQVNQQEITNQVKHLQRASFVQPNQ